MWESIRRQLIVKLGGFLEKGYPDAETAIEGAESVEEKRRLLTLAVKRCFNTIGPEDILKVRYDGKWILEEKPISDAEKDLLVAEADHFRKSFLWKALKTDVKHQANKATFLKAQTDDDLTAGKLWMWTLDTFATRLKSLSEGSGHFNKNP